MLYSEDMEYKGIVFDFFGVICPDTHKEWMKENGFDANTVELIEESCAQADTGELSIEDHYKAVGSVVNRSPEAVESEINSFIEINDAVIELVQKLKKTYTVVLCSNAPTGYVESILKEHGLEDIFEQTFISSQLGCKKPEHAIYEKVIRTLDLSPQELLFIDDNIENIRAAQAINVDTLLFQSPEQIEKKISDNIRIYGT